MRRARRLTNLVGRRLFGVVEFRADADFGVAVEPDEIEGLVNGGEILRRGLVTLGIEDAENLVGLFAELTGPSGGRRPRGIGR